jgi:hypothetical protein
MFTKILSDVALADAGRNAGARHCGTIGCRLYDLDRQIKKLPSTNKELNFVYEAGPWGYDIFRYLPDKGFYWAVDSPEHIPKSPANRVKTDRSDARTLARLYRATELAYVFVPRADDEAVRDLIRAREDAKKAQRVAQQQLNGMLLRLSFWRQKR